MFFQDFCSFYTIELHEHCHVCLIAFFSVGIIITYVHLRKCMHMFPTVGEYFQLKDLQILHFNTIRKLYNTIRKLMMFMFAFI